MSLFPSSFSLVKYAEPKLVTDDKENKVNFYLVLVLHFEKF